MRKTVAMIALAIGVPAMASATELPVSFVDNRPFVDVRVDGQGPFSFLLDTGSSSTTLNADLARRLHLRPAGASQGSGAGNASVSFKVVHISALSIGPVSIGPLDAPAMDVKRLSRVIGFRRFDGVLGAEIFKTHVVILDNSRRRLSIVDAPRFRPPARAVAIPFALDEDDMPVIKASVAGVAGAFQIDTGDRSSLTLFGPFWRKYGLDKRVAPAVEAMTGYGMGGPILALVGRPSSVTIGGVALPAPVTRLSLQTGGTFTRTDRAGSIGMGILKRFDIAFDYRHHMMWLSKGQSFDAPDRYDRSGLWLGLSGGRELQVVAVTPDSPAAQAGMKAGDIVTSVGSLAATAANLFAIRDLLREASLRDVRICVMRDGRPQSRKMILRDQIAPPDAAAR